uniref:VHS domain-containing protein n=1 Tax=Mesocestoides corti TaxID=53468 RepID=A0A5K3F3Y7_MESCO
MAGNPESLENMITEVTSPLATHIDLNAFKKIYDQINAEANAPETALRLLAHKVQSPQEKEAMSALVILDLCVQNCGSRFHDELGKFKFLNELIKVLSPKYLGESTSPAVRDKCIMLLFTWQRDLGQKYPKIREAYQMLRTQNIITEDPVIPNEAETNLEYLQRMANRTDIFKNSRHSAKLLRLLKSRNPDDYREANAIIKSIVSEEDARVEKRSKRALELETLRSNADLLEEMLKCLGPGEPSPSDADVMEEIVANIKRSRPIIFELALTDEDREEGFLADVIDSCSRASTVLERYEVIVLHQPPSTVSDPAAPPPPPPPPPQESQPPDLLQLVPEAHQDLLTHDLLMLGISDAEAPAVPEVASDPPPPPLLQSYSSSNADLLSDLLCVASPASPSVTSVIPATTTESVKIPTEPPQPRSSPLINTTTTPALATPGGALRQPASTSSGLDDLDAVSQELLGLMTQSGSGGPRSASLNSLLRDQSPRKPDPLPPPTPPATNSAPPALTSLPDLPLSAIKPHPRHTQPLCVFPSPTDEEASSQPEVVLHFTANRPGPSVSVFVAVITNRSALPLTELLLRFGVEKPLKLRQLPASTTSLPAFCPFLPPSPAQQIIYIQRPLDAEIATAKVKFQIAYTLDDENVLESGVVTVPLD